MQKGARCLSNNLSLKWWTKQLHKWSAKWKWRRVDAIPAIHVPSGVNNRASVTGIVGKWKWCWVYRSQLSYLALHCGRQANQICKVIFFQRIHAIFCWINNIIGALAGETKQQSANLTTLPRSHNTAIPMKTTWTLRFLKLLKWSLLARKWKKLPTFPRSYWLFPGQYSMTFIKRHPPENEKAPLKSFTRCCELIAIITETAYLQSQQATRSHGHRRWVITTSSLRKFLRWYDRYSSLKLHSLDQSQQKVTKRKCSHARKPFTIKFPVLNASKLNSYSGQKSASRQILDFGPVI